VTLTSPPPARGLSRFAIAYLLLAPLYVAPLVATRFLPALDLPHHLALADAIAKAGPDSPYARLYAVDLAALPFAAHFALLVLLSTVMPLGAAAKVLVGAQVLALPLAGARLLAVRGRSPIPALLTFPIGYGMHVHYGLLAFVVALPVLVWTLAEAAHEAEWTHRPHRQALVLAAALLALFFAHLEAYLVGAVTAVLVVALHPGPSWRRALGLAAALPSLAALSVYGARTLAGGPSLAGSLAEATLAELRGEGLLGTVVLRTRALPVHLLRGFRDGQDVAASAVFFAAVVTLSLAARRIRDDGRGADRPRWAADAALVLAALAAYYLLPHHVHPYAHSVYPRFAVLVAIVALLAVPARLAFAGAAVLRGLTAALALATACYAGVLWREYRAFGREMSDFERVLQQVEPGHFAGGLVFDAESRVMRVEAILSGVPAYYVTERRAATSATYLHYCGEPHLPCRPAHPEAPPALPHFTQPEALDPQRALEVVDLFFVRGGPSAEEIFGAESARVRLIASSGRWRALQRR
jgi:hypothetical protein